MHKVYMSTWANEKNPQTNKKQKTRFNIVYCVYSLLFGNICQSMARCPSITTCHKKSWYAIIHVCPDSEKIQDFLILVP